MPTSPGAGLHCCACSAATERDDGPGTPMVELGGSVKSCIRGPWLWADILAGTEVDRGTGCGRSA